jgi:hypothetical protein
MCKWCISVFLALLSCASSAQSESIELDKTWYVHEIRLHNGEILQPYHDCTSNISLSLSHSPVTGLEGEQGCPEKTAYVLSGRLYCNDYTIRVSQFEPDKGTLHTACALTTTRLGCCTDMLSSTYGELLSKVVRFHTGNDVLVLQTARNDEVVFAHNRPMFVVDQMPAPRSIQLELLSWVRDFPSTVSTMGIFILAYGFTLVLLRFAFRKPVRFRYFYFLLTINFALIVLLELAPWIFYVVLFRPETIPEMGIFVLAYGLILALLKFAFRKPVRFRYFYVLLTINLALVGLLFYLL